MLGARLRLVLLAHFRACHLALLARVLGGRLLLLLLLLWPGLLSRCGACCLRQWLLLDGGLSMLPLLLLLQRPSRWWRRAA